MGQAAESDATTGMLGYPVLVIGRDRIDGAVAHAAGHVGVPPLDETTPL